MSLTTLDIKLKINIINQWTLMNIFVNKRLSCLHLSKYNPVCCNFIGTDSHCVYQHHTWKVRDEATIGTGYDNR